MEKRSAVIRVLTDKDTQHHLQKNGTQFMFCMRIKHIMGVTRRGGSRKDASAGYHMKTLEIWDTKEYLKTAYPGRSFELRRSFGIDDGSVPAYIIEEYNGCAVNAAACLIAATRQAESFSTALGSCLDVAEHGYSKVRNGERNYYIKLGTEAPFIRKCLRSVASGLRARSSIFVKNRAIKEIMQGRPVLLNIGLSRQYLDHTVTAYGFEEYVSDCGKKALFFRIRDGYTTQIRYLEFKKILGISITYLK